MGRINKNHFIKKFALVVVVELIAFAIMKLLSMYVVYIPSVSIPYILFGGILAYMVVVEYDKFQVRKRDKIRGEMKSLEDVARHNYKERQEDLSDKYRQ